MVEPPQTTAEPEPKPEAKRPRRKPPKRRRVFFGLAPDAETRAALVRATRRAVKAAGGRATPAGNLHLTLAFLGEITPAELARARRVPPIAVAPFTIELDRLGFWSRNQILWLGPSAPPAPLIELERALWAGLVAQRFERPAGRFRPHLTLARRARAAHAPIEAVRWNVARLTLFESRQTVRGVQYDPLAEWAL